MILNKGNRFQVLEELEDNRCMIADTTLVNRHSVMRLWVKLMTSLMLYKLIDCRTHGPIRPLPTYTFQLFVSDDQIRVTAITIS